MAPPRKTVVTPGAQRKREYDQRKRLGLAADCRIRKYSVGTAYKIPSGTPWTDHDDKGVRKYLKPHPPRCKCQAGWLKIRGGLIRFDAVPDDFVIRKIDEKRIAQRGVP
jgi:hypothetical protein